MVKDERVRTLLEEETLGRLQSFARYETPKKIAILAEEFTVESGILTPTMKVKRQVVEKRYSAGVEAPYHASRIHSGGESAPQRSG